MYGSMETILRVQQLTKLFNGTVAVQNLSFDVSRGEIVGILGANGAGKSTTLQMILGLVRPTSGRIEVFGHELEQHRIAILQRMNFTAVNVNLPMNLRVWQNLWVAGRLYGVNHLGERIDAVLELLEIAHLRDTVSGQLSNGELTRLNLCKALLNDPELLLLDEPTASLDPNIADKVRKLLIQIQRTRRMTMLYTSHNMRDIEEVCDRILFLHNGRLLTQGTPEQVKAQFGSQSLEEVFIRIARSGEIVIDGDGPS